MPQRPITMKPARVKHRVSVISQQPRGKYDHYWTKLRRLKLDEDPMCAECARNGVTTAANEVDHIVPVSQKPGGMYEWSNFQSLCKSCHSRKTRGEMDSKQYAYRR